MYNGKHRSFKSVLWRAMKHEFCSDLSEEQAADYALELLRRLKLPFSYKDHVGYLEVKDYRAHIPKDLVYFEGMRLLLNDLPANVTYESTPDFIKDQKLLSFFHSPESKWLVIRYTGDIYHSSFHCYDNEFEEADTDITYKINNNYIYLSRQKGFIQVSYRALMLDEEGYPLIPDDQSFEDALYYYILKEHLFSLWGIGKVTDKFYNKLEQEYAWAVGQATNAMKLAGIDHWEETMNGVRRLIQSQDFSRYGYKELHKREQIKKTFQ